MATALAGQSVNSRVVRLAGSVNVVCQGPRMPHLAFSNSIRGTAVTPRTAEIRAQRATVCVKAARDDKADDDYENDDGFQERVVQVRRVTKVVKGGKQLSFRAVVSRDSGEMHLTCVVACGGMQAADFYYFLVTSHIFFDLLNSHFPSLSIYAGYCRR